MPAAPPGTEAVVSWVAVTSSDPSAVGRRMDEANGYDDFPALEAPAEASSGAVEASSGLAEASSGVAESSSVRVDASGVASAQTAGAPDETTPLDVLRKLSHFLFQQMVAGEAPRVENRNVGGTSVAVGVARRVASELLGQEFNDLQNVGDSSTNITLRIDAGIDASAELQLVLAKWPEPPYEYPSPEQIDDVKGLTPLSSTVSLELRYPTTAAARRRASEEGSSGGSSNNCSSSGDSQALEME